MSRKESTATCQAEIAAANATDTHTTYEPLKYRMGVEFGDRYEALYFQDDILTGATLASNEPMDDRRVDQIKAGVS